MDGEAMFTLAESSSFDSQFSLFINTISQSKDAAQNISFPFGHRIKLQAAIRELAMIPAINHLDRQLSSHVVPVESGCIPSDNTQALPQVESTRVDGPPPISQAQTAAPCVASHTPNRAQGDCPARSPPQQELGGASSSANFPIYYQTVDHDEPVLVLLPLSEATPAGLKRAIARAEGECTLHKIKFT